jgi:hypothetical protein
MWEGVSGRSYFKSRIFVFEKKVRETHLNTSSTHVGQSLQLIFPHNHAGPRHDLTPAPDFFHGRTSNVLQMKRKVFSAYFVEFVRHGRFYLERLCLEIIGQSFFNAVHSFETHMRRQHRVLVATVAAAPKIMLNGAADEAIAVARRIENAVEGRVCLKKRIAILFDIGLCAHVLGGAALFVQLALHNCRLNADIVFG